MNLYWMITLGILAHLVLALFSCLTVKDSFSLPASRKRLYYVLAISLPLIGSLISFNRVAKSKKTNNAHSGVFMGGAGSSDCSGSDGGGSE